MRDPDRGDEHFERELRINRLDLGYQLHQPAVEVGVTSAVRPPGGPWASRIRGHLLSVAEATINRPRPGPHPARRAPRRSPGSAALALRARAGPAAQCRSGTARPGRPPP